MGSWTCPHFSILSQTSSSNNSSNNNYNSSSNNSSNNNYNNYNSSSNTSLPPFNSTTQPFIKNPPIHPYSNISIASNGSLVSNPTSSRSTSIEPGSVRSTTTTTSLSPSFSPLSTVSISCTCSLPHTLRCDGSILANKKDVRTALENILQRIRFQRE